MSFKRLKKSIKLCLLWIASEIFSNRTDILTALNLAVAFVSMTTLVRLEEVSIKVSTALQKCEIILVEKPVEITEKSAVGFNPEIIGLTVSVTCLLILICVMLNAYVNPPVEEVVTHFCFSPIRSGVVTLFEERSLGIPAMLIKHAEGDYSLILESPKVFRPKYLQGLMKELVAVTDTSVNVSETLVTSPVPELLATTLTTIS